MNKVELIGRLTKDIELKKTQNGKSFCNFTIACDRRFKDANGQRQADFISCIAWNQTADFLGKYFRKGSRIGVCGSIQTRTSEKDGAKTYYTEVLVEEAEFVESASAAPAPEAPSEKIAEPASKVISEGLPFEL